MSRILLSVVLAVALVSSADAAGFRRRAQGTAVVAFSGSAQRFAEFLAARGSLVHASSHPGYEGVGVGGSPQAALAAACNNGGAVLEEGVARGRDGRWYACRRYSIR